MTKTATAALAVAAVASATAVCGAVYTGVTGHETPWNDDTGARWVIILSNVLLAALYSLLAVSLVRSGTVIDAGRRTVRTVRTALVADLAVLAGVFVIAIPRGSLEGPVTAVAGVAFLLAFLLGAVLGVLLLRRHDLRGPALLLLAPLAVVPLLILIGLRFPHWVDPAYAEAGLYLGLALLGAPALPASVPSTRVASAA